MRLFCFPHGGGGSSTYRDWPARLPKGVEMVAVVPPGRERRFSEPAFSHVAPLVETLIPALIPRLDRPFAFFGHSVGALIAFELHRALRRRQAPLPRLFVASGRTAPRVPHSQPPLRHLEGEAFVAGLRAMGGTPKAFTDNPDLVQAYEPLLKADFSVTETYVYAPEAPLDLPLIALGGREDETVPLADLEAWREETTGPFECHLFDGGHFFINDQSEAITTLLGQALSA